MNEAYAGAQKPHQDAHDREERRHSGLAVQPSAAESKQRDRQAVLGADTGVFQVPALRGFAVFTSLLRNRQDP